MTGKDIDLATTMDDLITNMFEQWEQKYGQLFVSHTLGLITASKRGLRYILKNHSSYISNS